MFLWGRCVFRETKVQLSTWVLTLSACEMLDCIIMWIIGWFVLRKWTSVGCPGWISLLFTLFTKCCWVAQNEAMNNVGEALAVYKTVINWFNLMMVDLLGSYSTWFLIYLLMVTLQSPLQPFCPCDHAWRDVSGQLNIQLEWNFTWTTSDVFCHKSTLWNLLFNL